MRSGYKVKPTLGVLGGLLAVAASSIVLRGATTEGQARPVPVPTDAGAGRPPAPPEDPSEPPALRALSAEEVAALRPLALRGAALLVRDADAGPRATVTVLLRSNATLEQVRQVISTPEQYGGFMPTISSVSVTARSERRAAFTFRVGAVLFDVETMAALNIVSPRRIDVDIVRSDIGPGASRWDLLPEPDGSTLVALSTWGDPSQGNWLLRQIAARSPASIAGMNIATDLVLALSVARSAEQRAGHATALRPADRESPPGPLSPPEAGPWLNLARTVSVGSVSLDAQGRFVQTSMAVFSPRSPAELLQRLSTPANYGQLWRQLRDSSVLPSDAGNVRFHTLIEGAMSRVEGETELEVQRRPEGATVWWHGVAGDLQGVEHRWDLHPAEGGSVMVLTGGSEYQRIPWPMRAMIGRDPWLLPGYAASWKLVWMRTLAMAP